MGDKISIYFAGAIRGGRGDQLLYLQIVELLREFGPVLTEHVADDLSATGEEMDDTTIHARDLSWLRAAGYLVAEVTIPSLGVGYEIAKASEWGKKVLCLYRPDQTRSLSAMIAGDPQITVVHYQHASELRRVFDEFFLVTRG